jgi:hypothetical protein
VATGFRDLAKGGAGSEPVDCSAAGTYCAAPDAPIAQPTRDLGVLPGGPVPAIRSGSHGDVPFGLRFAGAGGGGANFDLTGSSNLAGARLALGRRTLAPAGDSHNPVAVGVDVPEGARPGTYAVTLAAAVSGGAQRRSGTMAFRVVAAPRVRRVRSAPGPRAHPRPRPRLTLRLRAAPRRAFTGGRARYRLIARNASRKASAFRTRVCELLPGKVQFAGASRRVEFSGRRICFRAGRLRPGRSVAARIHVYVNRDARPGRARARASATAANARHARARASLRVVRRAQRPRRAPVTG